MPLAFSVPRLLTEKLTDLLFDVNHEALIDVLNALLIVVLTELIFVKI